MASSSFARAYIYHHSRFYAAALLGAVVFFVCRHLALPIRIAAAGDTFFAAYLIATAWLVVRLDEEGLKRRAAVEDEGAVIVFLIAIGIIALCVFGIFTLLNQKQSPGTAVFMLSVASAPLGWFTLHVLSAFHYANLHYLCTPDRKGGALKFPGQGEPGAVDFLYFSFVVGMTAQVSDVQVLTTSMRRATLFHSIVSFFFNTVLIAMAVNAVVILAS
ncbi:MAG TPA: DUF1345 domain-containing protein [Rhizomicrobium sp.]|nr:DUF1345 domain-containing protein [Rhizomicrobium sp.]